MFMFLPHRLKKLRMFVGGENYSKISKRVLIVLLCKEFSFTIVAVSISVVHLIKLDT